MRSADAPSSVIVRSLRCLAAVLALLVAAAAASPSLFADEQERLSIDQAIVAEDGESVTAIVSVLDATGRPVTGLTGFQAEIDGRSAIPDNVRSVLDEGRGISTLLLMDTSGTMEGEPLRQAKAAAVAFIDGMYEHDVAALMVFAGTAPDVALFTAERSALLENVARMEVEPLTGTALYDAVVNGLAAIAARAPTERRAIVLLTDGGRGVAVNRHTSEDALRSAADTGIPIFAVGLGEEVDGAFLGALASAANGGSYRASSPADLPSIFDLIAETLRSQYALVVPLDPDGGSRQELTVRVQAGERTLTARADVVLHQPGPASPASAFPPVIAIGLVSVAAVALAGGAVLVVRRRRRGKGAPYAGSAAGSPLSVRTSTNGRAEANVAGKLTVVAGPNEGTSVLLTDGAISIGSDPACALRLDAGDSVVAGTHARVWLQRGRLMVHHLARGRETRVQESPLEWAALESHDLLRIGPHVIEFVLETPT